jgi:ppGpp synthetase/RelA/SpoT-type nucleotidyltranferase
MRDLERARKLWLLQEPLFNEYGKLVAEHLKKTLKPAGVWFEITSRAKTVDSLVKKLIKKPKHSYQSLPDKAGVRVVVRYRRDLSLVMPLIKSAVDYKQVDMKSLGTSKVGYASIHVDKVRLPTTHPECKRFPFKMFWVELQVRTLAQHLWSEMSHDSLYKNDETIQLLPDDVKRRVNLMAGQIEVADREFDKIEVEMRAEDAAELLHLLESKYYQLTSRKPDLELSLIVIRKILPLYKAGIQDAKARIERFLGKKRESLIEIYDLAQGPDARALSTFLFQPEALVLYERLVNDKSNLRRIWTASFPESELEKLAGTFGVSFF